VAGQSLPASVAVRKDVGEADSRLNLARRVEDFVQTAYKSEAPSYVGAQLGEVIRARLALRDAREHLAAGMEGAIDIGFFELVGHHAGDGRGIAATEGNGPVLFEVEESGFGLGLIPGAVGR